MFRLRFSPSTSPHCPLRPLLAVCLAVASLPAAAQHLDYGGFEALFGEPVTTSITGSPQRASAVPGNMMIIDAETIRRSGARDLPGLLAQTGGLSVLAWSNSASDVSVHGYNRAFSARVLVLVNGRQVYADHYGYTPWNALPVELGDIRQIEVVKGPNSALFGFNAVGGVINIITWNPLHDDESHVQARAGTQEHLEVSAGARLAHGERAALRLSLGLRRNEDFDTPQLLIDRGSRLGDERQNLRLDGHYELQPGLLAEAEASFSRAQYSSMSPVYTMAFEDIRFASIKGGLVADTGLGLWEASLYHNRIDNDVYAGFSFDSLSNVAEDGPVANFDNAMTDIKLQDVFKLGPSHTFRLALEYRDSALDTSPIQGAEVSYDILSASAMWQWQVSPVLSLTTALRHDHLSLGRKGSVPPGYGLANSDWDRTLGEWSYNLGLVWTPGDRDTWRLLAARGVQLPNLYNLGGGLGGIDLPPEFGPPFRVYFGGVPDLQPATVDNYQLTWERDWGERARVALSLFHARNRDLMADAGAYRPELNMVSAPSNIGDSKTHGFDAALAGELGARWRWRLSYLWQEVDDEFDAAMPYFITLVDYESGTPEQTLKASLGWSAGAWELDAHVRHLSAYRGLRPAFFDIPGNRLSDAHVPVAEHTVLDARIAYRITPRVTLSLDGQNLLEGEQRQTSGAEIERRVLGTLNIAF